MKRHSMRHRRTGHEPKGPAEPLKAVKLQGPPRREGPEPPGALGWKTSKAIRRPKQRTKFVMPKKDKYGYY